MGKQRGLDMTIMATFCNLMVGNYGLTLKTRSTSAPCTRFPAMYLPLYMLGYIGTELSTRQQSCISSYLTELEIAPFTPSSAYLLVPHIGTPVETLEIPTQWQTSVGEKMSISQRTAIYQKRPSKNIMSTPLLCPHKRRESYSENWTLQSYRLSQSCIC